MTPGRRRAAARAADEHRRATGAAARPAARLPVALAGRAVEAPALATDGRGRDPGRACCGLAHPQMLRDRGHGAVSFGTVSHPSLGLPPRSLQAGFPDAAARLRTNRAALAVRALEVAVDADPTMRDPLRRRRAAEPPARRRGPRGPPGALRRRRRPALAGAVRRHDGHRVPPPGRPDGRRRPADGGPAGRRPRRPLDRGDGPRRRALDEAVKVYRWYRRLSGDARKKNRIVDAIYKGI